MDISLDRIDLIVGFVKKASRYIKRAFVIVSVWLFLWFCLVTHLEPTEAGIARNWINGELRLLDKSGWHVTPPWVWVCKVPTTPLRVGISTASKAYDSKLVQFDKKHYKEFVETEGWYFYWWYNRLSFNYGYDRLEEYRGFRDIARAYAYSTKQYPFFVILDEYTKEWSE